VVGVGLVGVLLVTALVLHGQSQRSHTTDASASPPTSRSAMTPSTTTDPRSGLGPQYLAIVAPANDALAAFSAACGCGRDQAATPASVQREISALPPFVAAKDAEAKALDTLSIDAPPLIASHLESMSHLEAAVAQSGRELMLRAATLTVEQAAAGLNRMNDELEQGQQLGATVRADLGLPASGDVGPATQQTV
jgi:hypothetical protein